MYYANVAVAAAAMLSGLASAKVITVEVGQNGGFQFTPNSITAAKGDIVDFHFDAMHSVIAGDFSNACNPVSSGGFFSGPMPNGNEDFFSVTVNSTDPIFFYCGVPGHCQAGMIGAINPSAGQTLAMYMNAAQNSDGTVTPKQNGPFGGILSSNAASSGASSGTAATSAKSGSSSPSQTATASSGASGAGASGSSMPSPTTVRSDASPFATSLGGFTCLILAGIATMIVL